MKTGLIVLNQKIELLEDIIGESKEHNYTTAEHVISHIQIYLHTLDSVKSNYEQGGKDE